MKTKTKKKQEKSVTETPPVMCQHSRMADIADLKPHPQNPNKHSDEQVALLAKNIRHLGWRHPIIVSNRTGFIVAGHARLQAAQVLNLANVPVDEQDFASETEERAYLIADNRIAELAEIQNAAIKDLLQELDTGEIDMDLTGYTEKAIEELMTQFHEADTDIDAEPQIDKAEELRARWGVEPGQLWELGDHRILCGDSTKIGDIRKLMGQEKAALLHADPPYGMGKEKDGVENDNLYADKLDAFQMEWWRAFRPSLEDNASAYIWGNAPDLWRLWYCGGLGDSEKLELRNQIVWDKKAIPGMKSDLLTQYPIASEHCLFFQLGDQFRGNVNIEDFPKDWEPIRAYFAHEAEIAEIQSNDIKRICGVQMFGHWFTKSQFTLMPEKHYQTIAAKYPGRFLRPWKEIKREWDAVKSGPTTLVQESRSYFDNAHDIMRDVWDFPRVTGDERHAHATPKPVEMMKRIMVSSLPKGGICVEPFGGSGSTLMGAENTGRKCRAIEISPAYVAVALQRWADATGKTPRLIE